MKQTLIIVFTLCLTSAMAQGSLEKGKAQLNAGFGFSTWGVPIYVGVDFGVHEDITVGGQLSYRNYAHSYVGDRYSQSLTVIGVNGNYHFNRILELPSEFDLYAGVTLGYYVWSDVRWKNNNQVVYGGEASGLGADIQVGGRYFFNDHFGINLELGGGTGAAGRFGITYKLR
jgi:outer membrane immunogenic protein